MDFAKVSSQLACAVALPVACATLLACGSNNATVANPTLAVADMNNNRVLVFNGPVSSAGDAAAVLGQTDLRHGDANQGSELAGRNTLNIPASVARDSSGNLYVADAGNSRVLIFRPPFRTGMDASVVIGQSGFTSSSTPLVGPDSTANSLVGPYAVAIDGKGNLWVSDVSTARVLEYTPPFTNGMAATLAIGQTSTGASTVCYENPPTANTLCDPEGMAFDAAGDLWLTDSTYRRVLEYKPPFSTGMAASLELGQPATAPFTSGTASVTPLGIPTADSLGVPVAVTFDANGDLWLADYGFNRVLEYAPPFRNGMAAISVLGQVDFTHGDTNRSNSSPAANTLSGPWGVTFDSSGNLNVADRGNSRILVFATPISQGMGATTVLGQPSFTTGSGNQGANTPTAGTLSQPFGLLSF